LGTAIIPVGSDTFKLLAAHLRAGGTTVIVSDRDIQGTGHRVRFFGRDVTLPQAAILLALRTGAPALGAFGYRHANNAITGRFTPQFEFSKSIERSSRDGRPSAPSLRTLLDVGMREIAALLEREISRDPGQWVVQQRIFTRAPTELSRAPVTRRLSKLVSAIFLAVVANRIAWMAGPS
jgi:lauroyl/myristoyl acyltransferase